MNETEAAQQIRDGLLPSPFKFGGMTLFALRVTSTGAAYRAGRDEHVWRSPELFLTEEFQARIPGLPIIWDHPEKSMLNSEEFANRVIGTAALPYIVGQDVWAVCRIYDDEAIKAMTEGRLSTSPAVVFQPSDGNTVVDLENGKTLLIEGIPSYLDHLAVCKSGVWDKSGPPSGVQNDLLPEQPTENADSVKELTMADETEKEREDKARKDAEDKARMDEKISMALDSISKRMDAMEMADKARKDAEEEKRREDAQHRRDAEREEWMKADAETCARDDAEEDADREKREKEGEAKEVAADKARKDRKDRMDKRRADAERAEKDRKDAEEKARKDAQPDLDKMIADAVAARMPRERNDNERAELADAQARADAVHSSFGTRAPPPMLSEAPADYRRRLLKPLQRHSKAWSNIELRGIADSVLAVAEAQIYADATTASRNTDDMPDGMLLPIRRTTESGHVVTEFRGKGTFITALKPNSMRVKRFKTTDKGA